MPWIIAGAAIVAVVLLGSIALRLLGAASARRQPDLGVADGKLAPCSAPPTSVSTQAQDVRHFIEPIRFSGPPAEIIKRLAAFVSSMPGTTVLEERADYLRAEFKSRVFGFVDDVEFFADGTTGTLHFRSASRVGQSDLGANRRRMETIRRAL